MGKGDTSVSRVQYTVLGHTLTNYFTFTKAEIFWQCP
jgi:hypothetical protein